MNSPQILLDVADGIATIRFNRPDAMNAFSDDMRESLLAHLQALSTRRDVRCVALTGSGRAFCAGGDVASMADLQARDDTTVVEGRIGVSGRILATLGEMPQPVVALINGAAAGAGMNLALACDMRLAVEGAIFSQAFVKIGLVPDWGGFRSLTRLAGPAVAMELMMTGARIDAAEAFRLGLVNRVLPADEFAAESARFLAALAAGPRETLAAIKRGVQIGETDDARAVLDYELKAQKALFLSADAREGMRAFLEKRPARFGQPD